MCPPGYRYIRFVATHAFGHIMCTVCASCISCAQVDELPQSDCGSNWEATLFS